MYEKKLIGRRPLYFRHAPPLTGLDDYSTDDLPKRPYPKAPPYQRSVYYYWWLFLKEHDGYLACCEAGGTGQFAELYADFGDIRGDDFMRWWKKTGRYLFCEPQDDPIYVHPSPQFRLDDDSRVVVSLPVERNVDEMLAELKQLLKPLRKEVPVKRMEGAKYSVLTKPVLSSLHQHYQVWQLRKQYPSKPQHELADLVGISVDDSGDEGKDVKQIKAITVSRYLKQAKSLIDYAGKGMFPIMNPTQAALNKVRGKE